MTIEDIVYKFNTTPFLFIGSGISRRYLNLPDWKGLLKHFAELVYDDEFAYNIFESQAQNLDCKTGLMPKVAELIQKEFDQKWFRDASLRTVDSSTIELIHNGLSPFKAELSNYIQQNSIINDSYKEEIDALSKLSEKSISGVITTNYDTFLEDHFSGFSKYVGQSQLIFSALQEFSEIYKIHGSIEQPDSIVINEKDYIQFDEKCSYLAAKLMTIFMEFPIIFMGYSISDNNIQNIIKSIVNCLDSDQLQLLEERFTFIEYKPDANGAEVTPYTIMVDDRPLVMKKIVLSDFMLLYRALDLKKTKLPVRMLRKFKQELYEYTITALPTGTLRVASIEDTRIADEDLVLAIGKASEFGLKGLSGLDGNEWYRNIVLDDLDFSITDLLQYAFPKLMHQNSGKLPAYKYLHEATKNFPEYAEQIKKQNFDSIISKTIKNNRQALGTYTSVMQIWENENENLERATRLIAYLPEEQFDLNELESILKGLFESDKNFLQNSETATRTHIRRLIRIYDYLKWGKVKELPD